MTDAIIDQTPNPDAPADSDLVAIYPGAPSTDDPDPRELGGGFLAWLKGLFSPKAADRWANYSNDFGQWAEVRADSLGLVSFFTGAPAAATLVVWDDYDAGKDLSGVTRIRVSKTLVGSDNYFADANAAFAGPEDEDRLVLHGDSPLRLSPYVTFTLTADAVSGGGGGVPEYWDLTGTTAQTGGNFIPGGEGFLRLTDAAPGGLVIPSNRIGLNGTFGARIVRLFEALPLAWLKRLRKIVQGNNETETLSVRRVNLTPAAPGEIYLGNLNNGVGQLLFWPPAQTKDGTVFLVSDLKEFKVGDFLSYGGLQWEIDAQPWIKFGNAGVLTSNVLLAGGYVYDANDVPALNATADFVLDGRDIHLGLVIVAILKRAAVNIGGKGGAAGKIWAYMSSNSNATWRRLLDVLKADADTAAKKADYRAALNTGRLDKDIAGSGALALTAAELGYNLIRLTGAKTGNRILSIPADRPVGHIIFRDDSTGAHDTRAKIATQADNAAIYLRPGDNALISHGGSLRRLTHAPSPPTAGTHRTAAHTFVAGDIGKWNSFLADNSSFDLTLNGDIGAIGDWFVLALRSQGNPTVNVKRANGTLKVYSALGVRTLNDASTQQLIGSGGNRQVIWTCLKTSDTGWSVYEGIWAQS